MLHHGRRYKDNEWDKKMFISPLIREMQFKSIMRCTWIRIANYKDWALVSVRAGGGAEFSSEL